MRTFAQKPKVPQQVTSVPSTVLGRAHFGQSPEVSAILHFQPTIGNQAVQRLLGPITGDVKGDSTFTESPRLGYDFSQIPLHPPAAAAIQTKLAINKPTDEYEQEAARVSEQIMRLPGPALQRTFSEEVNNKNQHGSKAGMTIVRLADWLPQTRGTGTGSAIVLPASAVADRDGANAVTLGGVVHLSSGISRLAPAEQQRVLAHEAVHVAQRSAPGPSAANERLEMEANQLSPQVLSGHPVQPRFHAGAMTALADDGGPLPNDIIAMRKAKARREVLLRYKAIYDDGRVSNPKMAAERQKISDKRDRLDASMKTNLLESEKHTGGKSRAVEEYQEEERKTLAVLNRKPVTLEVTATTVRIRARFQVRFEGLTDKEAAKKFPVLKQNLQKGVSDTWNQELQGAVLRGRTFEMIPEINLVSSTAARDENFWLITVRPTNEGPMSYEKKSLGTAPYGVPTSVTMPTVASGVMSLPPSHIEKPDILGHETLHLFGLVDRYFIHPKLGEFALRDTKGRQDPLGADEDGKVKGKILEEDLGFVLDEFGVYPRITYEQVLIELNQVDELIKTGRDPNSLIKKRKNFEPEMIKQAEDLP